jgi:23S rRNA pseudouridine1911/1915/1917 synthase
VTIELSSGTGVPGDYRERQLDVIYEDPWIVVIDKPPGLLVHPVGRHVYDTLLNYLHHRYDPRRSGDAGELPRLCHRVDKDTTGLVLVAKDAYVHRALMDQFEARRVEKEYVALVHGGGLASTETVEIPIGAGRDLDSALNHPVLRQATTVVHVEERLGDFTLVRCLPRTGRQNQIRIHLAARGHPIAGDSRYGAPSPASNTPGRYLLHAQRLRFRHPRLRSDLVVEAPLPADFRTLLSLFRDGFPAENDP